MIGVVLLVVLLFSVLIPVVFRGDAAANGSILTRANPFFVSPSCVLIGVGSHYWSGAYSLGCQLPPVNIALQ